MEMIIGSSRIIPRNGWFEIPIPEPVYYQILISNKSVVIETPTCENDKHENTKSNPRLTGGRRILDKYEVSA